MLKRKKIFLFSLLGLSIFFISCVNGVKTSVDITKDWKLSLQDKMDFASPNFDDSSWESRASISSVNFGTVGEHYYWIRKTIPIPKSLQNDNIYLGFDRGNYAVDVYAGGTYIGSRGSLPPNYNMRIENSLDILIPQNCINNNEVTLALRVYTLETDIKNMNLYLDSPAQAFFQNKIHNIFTTL